MVCHDDWRADSPCHDASVEIGAAPAPLTQARLATTLGRGYVAGITCTITTRKRQRGGTRSEKIDESSSKRFCTSDSFMHAAAIMLILQICAIGDVSPS